MRKSLFALLLVVTLLLAACGPAMTPATTTTEGGEVFTIALPRIVVDYNEAGTPSIGGLDLAQVAKFTGFDLRSMTLPKMYLDWMRNANVQHIELRQGGDGMFVFVNGKPMPYLGWDDASLQRASDVAGILKVQNSDAIRKFLPIVRRLGLDVVMRFPKQAGAAEIPLASPDILNQMAAAKAAVPPASAVMQFEVKYDQNGTPAVLGITPYDLMAMGINPGSTNLSPTYLQWLQKNNIQNLELRGKGDGVYVYVNGQPLPNVVWNDALLTNLADVYGQMNDPNQPMVQLVKGLLPLVNKADVAVLIHFPVAAGQATIPAKMQ